MLLTRSLPLMEALTDDGFPTAMPVTPEPGNPLLFRAWAPGAPLTDGPYNTKQPPSDAAEMIPSVILAPMLAFDSSCWRLGYGGGFYDRTLSGLRAAGRHVVAHVSDAYLCHQHYQCARKEPPHGTRTCAQPRNDSSKVSGLRQGAARDRLRGGPTTPLRRRCARSGAVRRCPMPVSSGWPTRC